MGKRTQIINTVRAELQDNHYGPTGSKMPGVYDICERFKCSTATAVYAMHYLAVEGHVDAQHGVGYFVGPKPVADSEAKIITRRIAELTDELVRCTDQLAALV